MGLRERYQLARDTALRERITIAIVIRAKQAVLDTQLASNQKLFALSVSQSPHQYVDPACLQVVANDALAAKASVSFDDVRKCWLVDASGITDDDLATLIDVCWGAILPPPVQG